MYFSFLELHDHLSNEYAWCPIIAEPSLGLKKVNAGISQAFAKTIKLFFNADTFDLSTAGMQLVGPDGSRARLFAVLDMVVQDGGAHKLIWGCKGDAGPRLCMLCKNLVSVSSGIAGEDGDRLVCG